MRLKTGILILVVFLIGTSVFLIGIGFWMVDPLNLKAPDDKKLLMNFHSHREAFEKLLKEVSDDSKFGSYVDASTIGAANDDLAQKQQMRRLLLEIHSGLVIRRDYDKTVRFIFAGGGLSAISPGWLKGIEYVAGDYNRKGVVLRDLNDARKLEPGVYLRPIESNWFLVYQRTD